ncbi:hypothetical protein [Curtobacterium luteum]|uniref:Uncharacterized protein n=1 Tax=Curtobacterium luteum TaxID=33881 RepID=A0A175S1P5_9MICO|nr:hypothetical protein [Curtobacterium luteum]KTR11705.1 hypothetical protein NS184_00455 [Curtobacterium luteum]
MKDDISPRLTAMRDALVSEVSSTRTTLGPRRRPTRGTVVAVVAAFLVGGALTGGLTAAALPGNDPDAAVETMLSTTARYMVEEVNHGAVLGTPTFRTAHGDSSSTLAHRPAGADRVVVAWACTDGDAPSVEVGGEPVVGAVCGRGDAAADRIGWGTAPVPTSGDATVTVAAGDADRYALWVSWARSPRIAAASAQQQAETADGVVTLDEYRTAFNRLAACQAQAGQPIGDVPLLWYADGTWNSAGRGAGPWYSVSPPSTDTDVFDTQCFPREFADVDALWQAEHPEPDEPSPTAG